MTPRAKRKGRPPTGTADAGKRLEGISDILTAKSSPDTALIEAIREHSGVTAAALDAADRIAAVMLFSAFTRRNPYDAAVDDLLRKCLDEVHALRDEQTRRKYEAERAAVDARKEAV